MSMTTQAARALAWLPLVVALPALGAPAAQDFFPQHTVLWFSLPDAPAFEEKFNNTQLGMLARDEALAPFCEHLRQQAMNRFGNVNASLGVSLEDVLEAAGGPFAMGVAHQQGQQATAMLFVDTRGKEAEAAQLVADVDKELTNRGATSKNETIAGAEVTVYTFPEEKGQKITRQQLFRFRRGNLLCYVESASETQAAIARFARSGTPTLAAQEGFQQTMQRCAAQSRVAPDALWFFDPFNYDLAHRSRQAEPALADRDDMVTLLRNQGFDAIRALGGHVHVAVDAQKDFVHRTAVYAPPKPGTEGRPAVERYDLGMRMVETPNRRDMTVENWAPRGTANYSTYSLDVDNAFDNMESVVDAIIGHKGSFQSTIDGFAKDHYGPKIKIREEIVDNLGDRITRMADYELPVSTDCERFLFVIDAKNPQDLKTPIDKWMDNDGYERRELHGVEYWEFIPEEETDISLELGGGLAALDDQPGAADEDDDRLLRRAAVCIHKGKLIIASDVEYLENAVFGVAAQDSLAMSYDFQAAMRELNALLTDPSRCSWSFTRSDESIRPIYEMLRKGKLPEGQTFFARLLNKLLTTPEDEEKGIVRKQRIDASRLPTFEMARRYFGPTARAIVSHDDGWLITGVVLNKAGVATVAAD